MKYRWHILLVLVLELFMATFCLGQALFFESVVSNNIAPNTSIHGITKDSIGCIWFGSWDGVYRYDGNDFDVYRNYTDNINSIPNNRIRNIVTDQNKQVWLLTFDRKYVKYNYSYDNFETISDRLVPGMVKSMLGSSSNLINQHSIVNGKRIILASNRLIEQDIHSKVEYQYQINTLQPGGLPDDYVTSFFIDDQQIVWLGNRSGEVFKANANRKPFRLSYYYNSDNIQNKLSVRVIQLNENGLLLGSSNDGLIFNQEQFSSNQNIDHISTVRALHFSKNGDTWIGSTSGLQKYEVAKNQLIPIFDRNVYPDKNIWSVYAIENASANDLWIALYNGLAKFNLTNKTLRFYDLTSLVHNHSVMDVMVDSNQFVWLATEGNGIIRLKFDEHWEIIDSVSISRSSLMPDAKLSGDMVYSIYESTDGHIWAATSDGLNCIDATNLEVRWFNDKNGLADNYISAVTGDTRGNIWVSHKKGLSKLDASSDKISNYTISDNYSRWTFMDGACYNDTTSNTIYFGAKQGLVSFRPDQIKPDPFLPHLILKKLSVNGKEIKPVETNGDQILSKALSGTHVIDLDFENRSFTIEMAAIHFESPENNQCVYLLEGYDEKWNHTSNSFAAYTKVPPGNYVFKAKALTSDNVFSEEVTLAIVIHSAWYASRWAYISYLIFAVLLFFFINREILSRERLKNQIRIGRLKVENQATISREKLEFFTNVSHELRTPLSLIADPIKQLQVKPLTNEKRELYFSLVNKNIGILSNLINQLLDFRKADAGKLEVKKTNCDLVQVINQCANDFRYIAEERNIKLRVDCKLEKLIANFDKDMLKQITQNLLANALKYTASKGEVVVRVSSSFSIMNIAIEDNGIGIEAKSLSNIFEPFNNEGAQPLNGNSTGLGLALTKKLVELLKGEIRIDSKPHHGTKVYLNLPFEKVGNTTLDQADPKNASPSVLIVEDNSDLQDYLSAALFDTFTVLQEYNGKNGLNSALENIPDILITDVMMPVMDGNELCQKLKLNKKTCHIPIIMLTAKTADEHKVQGLLTGVDVYLTKPFNVDVLKAQLNSILENGKRRQKYLAGKTTIDELQDESQTVDNEFLNNVLEIIKSNIENTAFGQEQLADEIAISQRQLYRKLQAISGSTVHEFVVRVRMDEAAKLLVDSNLNVSQVAYKVGFTEASNFSRTFSKHFGVSPSKYRK